MRPTDEGRIEKIKIIKSRVDLKPPLGFAEDAGGHNV
jgi:hypothetical protein